MLVPTNQAPDALLSEILGKLVPFNCVPDAEVNVTLALARSRGVELATMSSVKPVEVTLMIFTDEITGASFGTTMVALGLGEGRVKATVCPLSVPVSEVRAIVMVPATLPT